MTDYQIVPEPDPRSRLGRPSVANLTRRLIHELQRRGVVVSVRDRVQLIKLQSLIDRLLHGQDEIQLD